MTDHNPKPRCPYCGHKMVHQYVYGDHFFRCPKCRSKAPDRGTEAEAYEAAMQRWQEPNRVLTLSELNAHNGFVWCEDRENANYSLPGHVENGGLYVAVVPPSWQESQGGYGGHWRCWLRKPTAEEREAVPWENP